MKVTAVILAGGKSSRMGENKALLPFRGRPHIEHLAEDLQETADDLLLVTNDFDTYKFLNISMVSDKEKDQGPLAGIEAGLSASKSDWNLVTACDMPFFSKKAAEVLVKTAETVSGIQAVVPKIDGRVHPLFALYHKSALPSAQDCLRNGERRIRNMLNFLKVAEVDNDMLKNAGMSDEEIDKAFFNMNRPEDYHWAESEKNKTRR